MEGGNIPETNPRKRAGSFFSFDSNAKAKAASIAVVLLLALLFTKNIWMGTGSIIFSDLDFGADDTIYIDKIFGLFNTQFSSFNFFNLSRLVFLLPFYLLSLLFQGIATQFLLRSIIVSVILMSAAGMYRLCDKILLKHFGNCTNYMHYFGLIAPALLYAINPWVIFRIQHIFLLPGYAMYPLVISYFLDLFRDEPLGAGAPVRIRLLPFRKGGVLIGEDLWKDIVAGIKLALCICIGSAAIHYFFYYVLTILFFGLAILFRNMHRCKTKWSCIKLFVRKNVTLWSTVFLFCAYWVVPYILTSMSTDIEPNNVNVVDTLEMFSRYSSFKNILYLISYWWPMFDMSKHLDNYFWISGGIFLFLVAYISLYRFNKHYYVALFSFAALFMVVFASGVKTDILDDINVFIVTKVPLIGHIFRDPNKLVGPYAAFFCLLLAFAINRYLFLLGRSGYGTIIQAFFLLLLIGAHFFYVRPFTTVYMQAYYSGSEVPKEYEKVNNNFSSRDGKIIWIPSMDDMNTSDGIANYQWNTSGEIGEALGLVKTAANYHQYSSKKNEIFQYENNDGIVPYFYSFVQYMLDRTGAQHLGSLLSWAGFNEVGYHNDVYRQEERQKFNYSVLKEQTDMEAHYKDGIFTLYNLEDTQKEVFAVNRSAYLTKDLYSFLYLLDDKDKLQISPQDTALIWSKLKKYKPVDINPSDLMVGDNRLDFIMPFVDDTYFTYPFDSINTGNPNTGWAKTMVKESEWYWIRQVNNISIKSFDYDYSHGIVYTNVSHKLSVPFSKIPMELQNQLVYTKDILNGFFTADNPDILKLTVFPEVDNRQGVLQGKLIRGYSGNNLWQVAKSKDMDVTSLQGGFISLRALVSGVNAGSINFKIHFFDRNGDEAGVAYAGKPNSLSDFTKTNMTCDTYVPENAVRMRIDILNVQDTAVDTTFWIHDFRIYNVSSFKMQNELSLHAKESSNDNRYRVFIRAYVSEASNGVELRGDGHNTEINLKDPRNTFRWIDMGTIKLREQTLEILPKDGLTIINTVVMIPCDKADAVLNRVQGKLKGQQLDFSLASTSYLSDSDFPVKGLENLRIFPETIDGSLQLMNSGGMTKQIDILNKGVYDFSLTGNLPEGSRITAEFSNENGVSKVLEMTVKSDELRRNFQGSHYSPVEQADKYFLQKSSDISDKWRVYKYGFRPVELDPGTYQLNITVDAAVNNLLERDSLHLIDTDEIVVPEYMLSQEEEIVSVYAEPPEIRQDTVDGKKTLINTPSKSKMWIIYGQNRVKVKKGEMIGIRVKADSTGLKDLHGKLIWMNGDNVLSSSVYVPYDEKTKEFYLICESPSDGYVKPCFFMRSDSVNVGMFSLDNYEFYILDDFAKIEGTSLVSQGAYQSVAAGTVDRKKGLIDQYTVKNGKYIVQNEAYNDLFRFLGIRNQTPMIVNFMHNVFLADKKTETGSITIAPRFLFMYYICVLISLLTILAGLLLVYRSKTTSRTGLRETDKSCGNCSLAREIQGGSDLLCFKKGVVDTDFVCTRHRSVQERGAKSGMKGTDD